MHISDIIVDILSLKNTTYKTLHAKAYGYYRPSKTERIRERKHLSSATVQVTLSRLKKRGLVERNNHIWSLTTKGMRYMKKVAGLKEREVLHKQPKNLIVAFDIPEYKKKERAWLRAELVSLGFTMLQKSLWFGPSPLPKDFITALGEKNIIQHTKFFKAEEYEIV